jgi:membrane protein implicated in regulation of membrane protease activity
VTTSSDRSDPSRSIFLRYLLLQIPGWVVLVLALLLARQWVEVPVWVFIVVPAIWVAKDLAVYPFVRSAYDNRPQPPGERLLGSRAIAIEPLEPSGYVRLGGELWRAVLAEGEPPLPKGAAVRVKAIDGLTLIVSRR